MLAQQDSVRQPLGHRDLERPLEVALGLVDAARKRGARGALRGVRLRLRRQAARVGELCAVELEAVHMARLFLSGRSYCLRSAWRARVRRVITAPSVVPSMAAISAQLNPPSTCRSSGSR